MSLSKSQVDTFFASVVWKEIESRIKRDLSDNEVAMENADPFLHGVAVGRKRAFGTLLGMNQILSDDASGKNPYGNKS